MFNPLIMRDGEGINSPTMGPGRPTKVLGKRSVPVEQDYSITPGDWDKPLNGHIMLRDLLTQKSGKKNRNWF
jgi:hypothetical protein